MIYFDNAATTYPKPECVISAVENSFRSFGANPGRAGHAMAYKTAEMIYNTRKSASDFFGADDPLRVIFTPNCTLALNYAIKGVARLNSHFIISSLEHNAVVRPLEALKKGGMCDYSVAKVGKTDIETVENFRKLIKPNTTAFVCTGASNVFGKRLPLRQISLLAHENNICFIVDCAQIAGIFDVKCKEIGADILCIAAHKGLYAPMSCGMMIFGSESKLNTIVEGGTGSYSYSFSQPDTLPDRFESGTLSVPLIAGVKSGIDFVNKIGIGNIKLHEERVIKYIYSELRNMKNIILYTNPFSKYEEFAPVLSFNVKNLNSEEVGAKLSEKNIAVRAGFHCAILAHQTYLTQNTGTVRISPSFFTNNKDVNLLLNSVFEIAKSQ